MLKLINPKFALTLIVIYSIAMLTFVFKLNGFNGLKFVAVYQFLVTLFFGWWIGHIYVTTDDEKEKKQVKKGHVMICIFFLTHR